MYSAASDVRAPCGWVCIRATEDELLFRERDKRERLQAINAGSGWELRRQRRIGEAVSDSVVGYATSRDRALAALFDSMTDDGWTDESVRRTVDQGHGVTAIDPHRSPLPRYAPRGETRPVPGPTYAPKLRTAADGGDAGFSNE